MRKTVLAAVLAVTPALFAGSAGAVTLTPGGPWDQRDEVHAIGGFFATTWDFVCSTKCKLLVSDWAVISDIFDVFDSTLGFLGSTNAVPDWVTLGCTGAFDPACFVTDPDVAWADPRFSKATFHLNAGSYLISVQSTYIPPQDDGTTFPDSTVQLRVAPIPLPASFGLLLAGSGLLGLLGLRRRHRDS